MPTAAFVLKYLIETFMYPAFVHQAVLYPFSAMFLTECLFEVTVIFRQRFSKLVLETTHINCEGCVFIS